MKKQEKYQCFSLEYVPYQELWVSSRTEKLFFILCISLEGKFSTSGGQNVNSNFNEEIKEFMINFV